MLEVCSKLDDNLIMTNLTPKTASPSGRVVYDAREILKTRSAKKHLAAMSRRVKSRSNITRVKSVEPFLGE